MRFLLDENMPPAFTDWLVKRGRDAEHVRDVGLRASPDASVWLRAADRDAVILTKDRDYRIRRLAAQRGPVVVWFNFPNMRLSAFMVAVSHRWTEIERRIGEGEVLVEVRPPPP